MIAEYYTLDFNSLLSVPLNLTILNIVKQRLVITESNTYSFLFGSCFYRKKTPA